MAGNNTKIVKRKGAGRPTKYNDEVVRKLEDILKIGGTVEDACDYAAISKETYYSWLETNKDFLTKMRSAKIYPDIAAKGVVVDKIVKGKDDVNARWWLEKRRPEEFGSQITPPPVAIQINFGSPEVDDWAV